MTDGTEYYRRYLDGDDSAVEDLVRLYRDRLIFFLYGFVSDFDTAEELAEELSIALEDAETLVANGFVTIDGLKAAETETLLDIPGIDAGVIADIIAKLGK